MAHTRPTMQTATWAMTRFCDAALDLLKNDRAANELRLYFYAVTLLGWSQIALAAKAWAGARSGRRIAAYLGTDHALTDPDAAAQMMRDGVNVNLMRHYRGVFHPKVMWFVAPRGGQILAGSNNLTDDGLRNNIEFATLTSLSGPDPELSKWHDEIVVASEPADASLLDSYRRDKEKFGRRRAKARQASTFTWSKRTSGNGVASAAPAGTGLGSTKSGDLILEVMPRETGTEGSQVQIPMSAAYRFFGLGRNEGDSVHLTIQDAAAGTSRRLTLTHNNNSTARLSIRELEYRSRPCILLFRKRGHRTFRFEVVRRAIDPGRYSYLLTQCPKRKSKRRWIIK